MPQNFEYFAILKQYKGSDDEDNADSVNLPFIKNIIYSVNVHSVSVKLMKNYRKDYVDVSIRQPVNHLSQDKLSLATCFFNTCLLLSPKNTYRYCQ